MMVRLLMSGEPMTAMFNMCLGISLDTFPQHAGATQRGEMLKGRAKKDYQREYMRNRNKLRKIWLYEKGSRGWVLAVGDYLIDTICIYCRYNGNPVYEEG